jgi:hypothetical protein
MWRLSFKEISAGCYRCEAHRDGRLRISRTAGDEILGDVAKDAFDVEVAAGTTPTEALYQVMLGLPTATNDRNLERPFGSWYVDLAEPKRRVVFDGRDNRLEVQDRSSRTLWHCDFRSEVDPSFFRQLTGSPVA